MAIDPKMLAAYRDLETEIDDDDVVEIEPETDEESEEEEHEEEESPEAEAMEHFLEMLMEHGAEIESAAHSVDLFAGDAELDDDTREQIASALEELPEELRAGIKTHLAALSMDELHELLEALEDAGAFENDAVVVPWLYYAARMG